MSNIILTDSGRMTEQQSRAVNLHHRIMSNGQLAADAFIDFCRGLKEMRDTRLFTELGFETFEAYTEEAVGLKQRQAYNYISTFERLGEPFLQSNANLGITKLQLLAAVSPSDRQELADNNDLESMSTAEVERLTEELRQAKEQLSLFRQEAENAGGKRDAGEAEEQARRLEELEEQLREAEEKRSEAERLAAEEKKRADALNPEMICEAKKKAEEKANRAAEKKIAAIQAEARQKVEAAEQEVAAAKTGAAEQARLAAEKAKKEMEETLSVRETEKAEALRKARELEEKLKATGNSEAVYLNFQMEQMQESFNRAFGCLEKLRQRDGQAAEKFRGAMKTVMENMAAKL